MMTRIEKCLDKIPSRFALATVASKRWEQLMQGGRPMVESPNSKSMNTVFKEIETGLLSLNMAERTIEKLGAPIPAPVELPSEEQLLSDMPDDPTDAASPPPELAPPPRRPAPRPRPRAPAAGPA